MKSRTAGILGGLALLVSGPVMAATTYGDGITLDASTALGDIEADPGGFEGSDLRVEGRVIAVIPDGTYVQIEDVDGAGLVVGAGEWTFSEEEIGLYLVAEGQLNRIEEGLDAVDGLEGGRGQGTRFGLSAVGAIVGEVEAIVLDGITAGPDGGVVPAIPPGSEGLPDKPAEGLDSDG